MTNTETYKHHRINPVTGQDERYFPMEETSSVDRESAKAAGLEIGKTRLGYRIIEAVMVPCKRVERINGIEVYVDTPTEEQHRRYKELIREELAEQDRTKQDGRCVIPDGKGGTMRCPCRIPNPEYTVGSEKSKTLPVPCEGCKYEEVKYAHTVISLSSLDQEDDDGDTVPFEPLSPACSFAADRYIELSERFIRFVEERSPALAPLAKQRVLEFSISEAAKRMDNPVSTCISRNEKLKRLTAEFLKNEI